ncbi:MAG: hypothetical protein MAG451_03064 [Anaerolineales bacterium]|nr:hypothetical protein [Anaerolineales bacterium]
MLGKIKGHALLVLFISLVLGLAAVGFLVVPSRLSGKMAPIQITLGTSDESAPDEATPSEETQTNNSEAKEVRVPSVALEKEQEAEGFLYDTGDKIVNLADPGGHRYLKIAVVLEIVPTDAEFYVLPSEAREEAEGKIREALDEHRPIIEDILTLKLSNKTFEEVFTVAGKEKLKQELRDGLNTRLTVGKVKAVYFTEFVIQ